jgi:CRP-like cAMP-binding protein
MTMSRSRTTFFNSLDPRLQDTLTEMGRYTYYEPTDIIYKQGTPASSVMVVMEGRVSVESPLSGEPFVCICSIGQLLGDSEILSERPQRRHTARALDEVILLTISHFDFTRLTAEEPWIWESIARDTQARLDTAQFWIAQLACIGSEQRLAQILLYFADQTPLRAGYPVRIDLTYAQLASWVGVNVRTIERHLKKWRKLRYIAPPGRGGRVTIMNAKEIGNIAAGPSTPVLKVPLNAGSMRQRPGRLSRPA